MEASDEHRNDAGKDGDPGKGMGSSGVTCGQATETGVRAGSGGIYGSEEDVSALKEIFNLYDIDKKGTVAINDLEGILQKVGYNPDAVKRITVAAAATDEAGMEARISFDDFIRLLEQAGPTDPLDGPDPKVVEFIRILEEYRVKCEEGGDYLEAGRALRQLDVLRKQETRRQQKAVRARQLYERRDVQLAHYMQYKDFNDAWSKYLEEYDRMAQLYTQQMTERHTADLMEYQKKLQQELRDKPPKWSKELLEWRRRQHLLARQKNYAEAQKSELQALLKRINARRKEHLKQRNLDSKRLLQRNRNVQNVLESKQNVEGIKLTEEIKKSVKGAIPGVMASTPPDPSQKIPPEARGRVRRKKKASGVASSVGFSPTAASATSTEAEGMENYQEDSCKDETFVTNEGYQEGDAPSEKRQQTA